MSLEGDTLDRLRRTIDEVASADVAELVAEARLEARTKVRAILVEAISEKLLELSDAQLGDRGAGDAPAPRAHGGATRPASKTASTADAGDEPATATRFTRAQRDAEDEDRTEHGTGCYVYGVVAEGVHLPPLMGIDGRHEVHLIGGEGIAAVSSEVALSEFGEESLQEHLADLQWLESNARRHEHILDRVREETTLVPMRLCTIYRDEQSVREMLAREYAFLADALKRLDGCTEWGLKIYVASDPSDGAVPAEAADEDAGVAEHGAGASYLMSKGLQERRREQSEEAVEGCCTAVHARLTEVSVEAKFNPVQPRELTQRDEPMIFNGVYLVEDEVSDEFAATVESLRSEVDRYGLELELTGPWPPYNFVNSPTEVGR